jgi:hypothetical protein
VVFMVRDGGFLFLFLSKGNKEMDAAVGAVVGAATSSLVASEWCSNSCCRTNIACCAFALASTRSSSKKSNSASNFDALLRLTELVFAVNGEAAHRCLWSGFNSNGSIAGRRT